jgi:hypothetical protein
MRSSEKSSNLSVDEHGRLRRDNSKPLVDALHQWMLLHRQRVTEKPDEVNRDRLNPNCNSAADPTRLSKQS